MYNENSIYLFIRFFYAVFIKKFNKKIFEKKDKERYNKIWIYLDEIINSAYIEFKFSISNKIRIYLCLCANFIFKIDACNGHQTSHQREESSQ